MARILILLSVILFNVYLTEQTFFLQKDFIEQINEEATTWEAGVNFDPSTTESRILKLLGSRGVQHVRNAEPELFKTIDENIDSGVFRPIPKEFDARKEWDQCSTIGEVPDQGTCGCCWAVSTSSAFSDRMCIASGGEFNQLLSIEDLAFCCKSCGDGCNGGYPIQAWIYFATDGLVTGGNYNTTDGCKPFKVAPCLEDESGRNTCSNRPAERNHICSRNCTGDEKLNYDADLRFGRDAYYLPYKAIQRDVLNYGPVEASFYVYSDFLNYKSGVYVKTKNATLLGGHSAKLIGWGEENHVPFWLMVNSWNKNWGDNGLFKIRRGTNECFVESSLSGGIPVTY